MPGTPSDNGPKAKSKDKSVELAKSSTLTRFKSNDTLGKGANVVTLKSSISDDTIKKGANIAKSGTTTTKSEDKAKSTPTKSNTNKSKEAIVAKESVATTREPSNSSDGGYKTLPLRNGPAKKNGASTSDEYKYKKSGGGYSSYKREKISDNYPKNKTKIDDELVSKGGSGESCSPKFYLIFLIVSFLILIALATTHQVLRRREKDKDTFAQNFTFSREVQRKHVAMITENMDCSILEKIMAMKDVPSPVTGIAAMMCLHLTDPHSMAPDAASSMLLYFQQDKNSLVKNYEAGFVKKWESCFSFDKKKTVDNSRCDIRSFRHFVNSFASFGGQRIADSDFWSASLLPANVFYKYHYAEVFRIFARFSDGGTPFYPQAANTMKYNNSNTEEPSIHRQFPVSKTFAKLVEQHKPDMSQWLKEVYGSTLQKITAKSKVSTTKEAVRHLINHYLYTTKTKKSVVEKTGKVMVTKGKVEYDIIFHKGGAQTSSVISAFIVKLVAGAFLQNEYIDTMNEVEKEAFFYGYLLVAQRLTYQLLPRTKEWNPQTTKKMLMQFATETINKLHNLLGSKELSIDSIRQEMEVEKKKLVTRKHADRVLTLMTWKRSYGDSAMTANFGLPKPFKSLYLSGKNNTDQFAPFASSAGGRSVPFTSSASLMLLEMPAGREQFDQDKLRLIATASGSIRTIEATATVVLRYLIFGEDSGAAVYAPAAYVSLLDGSFRCENKRHLTDKKTPFSEVTNIIEQKMGIKCKDVGKRFEEKDRMAVAISHRNLDEYLKASVDDRAKHHNYATGY